MSFERLELLIHKKGLETLRNSSVLVLGIGGVGGHCAEALVRSGIGTIIIVDKDVVDASNINRQLVASHSTIGKSKVKVLKERLLDINPDLNVIDYQVFYNFDTKHEIIENKIDFICDCIDTITFKIDVIKDAIDKNIPIISAMGAGNKMSPERMEIDFLHKTSYDPIAKVIRTKLRKEGYKAHIPVVYSKEEPIKVQGQVLGSTAFTPSVSGLLMASYVVRSLLE
jgi:tRNA A37 threonylcarbamoyladenosine dehydratase